MSVLPLLFGMPLQDSLLRAVTFTIVASPCAVVLAAMPPLLAAIATAGRNGVLVKSAVVMEIGGTTTPDVTVFSEGGSRAGALQGQPARGGLPHVGRSLAVLRLPVGL